MSTVRIVYVVIDTKQLTLYKEDGSKIYVPQGDSRVRTIIDQALPLVNQGKVAEIDLSVPGSYEEFEKQGSGLVRFFKVAKKKLASLFSEPVEPIIPGSFGKQPVLSKADQISEILAHAVPAKNNITPEEAQENTVIAVVNDNIVCGVEQVHAHIEHAAKLGSTKGMEKFLERIAAVSKPRHHSVDDLLRFMERGDLPVADDGSIIAYKALEGIGGGIYVDLHTRKVKQRVGTEVRVDESLVDRNRSNECSNGLHIARRGYLNTFIGSHCFLVKVAPEDVVTVPHKDPNKVRVCAYHIIEKLTDEAYRTVLGNKPMTDCAESRTMLARAISGDHVGILERVHITKPLGEGLIVTMVNEDAVAPVTPIAEVKNAVALDDPELKSSTVVSPKTIAEEAKASQNQQKEQHMKSVAPAKLSRKEVAGMLTTRLMGVETTLEERTLAAIDLQAYKKQVKLGWDALGVTEAQVSMMEKMLADVAPPVKVSKKTKNVAARLNQR